jgi:hypothetical protein
VYVNESVTPALTAERFASTDFGRNALGQADRWLIVTAI